MFVGARVKYVRIINALPRPTRTPTCYLCLENLLLNDSDPVQGR